MPEPSDLLNICDLFSGSLEELLEAIEAAVDGETIYIKEQINIREDCIIGNKSKAVRLQKVGEQSGHFFAPNSDVTLTLRNLVVDGAYNAGIMNCPAKLICTDCVFIHCRDGITFYNEPPEFTNCCFDSVNSPINDAKNPKMLKCTFEKCSGIFSCVSAHGEVVIDNCSFSNNSIPFDCGAFYLSEGSASITDTIFKGNTVLAGSGGAIRSNGNIIISGCTFFDNSAGVEGDDIMIIGGTFEIQDDTESLSELYEAAGIDFDGIYYDNFESRHSARCNFESIINATDKTALAFVAKRVEPEPVVVYVEIPVEVEKPITVEVERIVEVEKPVTVEIEKVIEVPTPPEIVTEYVPVHHTEIVEVEKVVERIIEVDHEKETAELNGVTLERNDDYLAGCYAALKGKDATRADVAQILYQLTKHLDTETPADFGYSDIPADAPYSNAVNALSDAGLFNGCGGNRFLPDSTMTKAQVIVVVSRLLDLQPAEDATGHWAMPYIVAAQARGYVGELTAQELDEAISMSELQEMISSLFAAKSS